MHTSSDHAMTLAGSWIDTCVKNHPKCKASELSSSYLPTRLIDVGPPDGSVDPCLVLPKMYGGFYEPSVSLSYCWGGRSEIQLTSLTFDTLRSGMPIEKFPKTIRDAIDITQRLHYRYIWVDALCVFQDSAEDWRNEAATMGDVYSNGVVTTAALGAKDADSGCYSRRNPLNWAPYRLIDLGNNRHVIAASEKLDPYFAGNPIEFSRFTSLQRRGWALQERILSPRTLHLGAFLAWECRLSLTLDAFPNDFRRLVKVFDSPKTNLTRLITRSDTSLRKTWKELLSAYTLTDLTQKDDRLEAISGIIKKIEQLTKGRNLWGLWASLTIPSLLWKRQSVRIEFYPPRAHATTRAPSWSWVAIDEPVQIDYSINFSLANFDSLGHQNSDSPTHENVDPS